jgi:DNA end-binding protein Ku
MAGQLIASMSGKWNPEDFHDEYRERLRAVIEKKMKAKGARAEIEEPDQDAPDDAATNVVDFMSLLKQSIASEKRTPAKKSVTKKAAGKKPAKKAGKRKAG